MKFDGFDWDDGNSEKCQSHGVTVAEVEDLFSRDVMVAPDPAHSGAEEPFKAIGRTVRHRPIFLVFTMRQRGGRVLIRPISARFMHAKEVEFYEAPADPGE